MRSSQSTICLFTAQRWSRSSLLQLHPDSKAGLSSRQTSRQHSSSSRCRSSCTGLSSPGEGDYSNRLVPLPLRPSGPCSHTVTYIFTNTERFIASLCGPMCNLKATLALITGVKQVCLPLPWLARKAGPPEHCCQQNPWHPVYLLLLNDSGYCGITQTYLCLCFGHSTLTARRCLKHQSLASSESGLVRAQKTPHIKLLKDLSSRGIPYII